MTRQKDDTTEASPDTVARTGPATIRDVARRAGVSLGTASNVLNRKSVVSQARRDLVLKAAAEIGYRPNRLARSLRRQSTQLIGLCVPMITSAYHSSLVEALNEVAFGSEWQLLQMLSRGEPERELAQIDTLLEHQVDGVILMPSSSPEEALERLALSGVPTVIVDRLIDPAGTFDLVMLDHRAAMRQAVEHLLELGHRRLLFIVRHPHLVTTAQRIDVLAEIAGGSAGTVSYEVLALVNEPVRLQPELADRLTRSGSPTAIIASNSINTLWTLRALKHLGYRVPRDISLLAFDEPAWGELVDPPLTVIRQPVEQIARETWNLLEQRIARPQGQRHQCVLPNALIVRASTAPPAGSR